MLRKNEKTKKPPYHLSAGYLLTVLFVKSTAAPCFRNIPDLCGAPRHSARYDSVPQRVFGLIAADDRCFLVFSGTGFMILHLLRPQMSAPGHSITYSFYEIKKKQKPHGTSVRRPGPRAFSGLLRDTGTTCEACPQER